MKEYVYPICNLFWSTHVVFTGDDVFRILRLYFLLRDEATDSDFNLDAGLPYKNLDVVNLYNTLVDRKQKKDDSM